MELLVLATEGGIPTSNPWSQLALPLGILIFVGTVYMLLRSNLGTRRGYLVMSTSLWGFGLLLSLFWTFGAPGTPPNTGPQNLPGQELNEYQPLWVPFAPSSTLATEEGSPYAQAAAYPDGWGEIPADFAEEANTGAQEIPSFFSSLEGLEEGQGQYFNVLTGTEVRVGDPLYAEAENGRPMIAATFVNTCEMDDEGAMVPAGCENSEVGDAVPEGSEGREEQVFFAFFDAGSPYFPSLLMTGIMIVLFVIHLALLARDEQREAAEVAEAAEEDTRVEERATVGV